MNFTRLPKNGRSLEHSKTAPVSVSCTHYRNDAKAFLPSLLTSSLHSRSHRICFKIVNVLCMLADYP
jgi:hypothetical protein